MNTRGASLLANPHPCSHIVYPYTDEGLVGQAVCLFASAGLRDGDGVVLIMTAEHCESIMLRLQVEGINTEHYQRLGQLICVTAEGLLAKFLPAGVLNEDLFKSMIGDLIDKARGHGGSVKSQRVRVFGEMVSQLRHQDLAATTRLEELWNGVINDHSVALLCTYALSHAHDRVPDALIALHSESIERESGVGQGI
jgi:hypothetical protein